MTRTIQHQEYALGYLEAVLRCVTSAAEGIRVEDVWMALEQAAPDGGALMGTIAQKWKRFPPGFLCVFSASPRRCVKVGGISNNLSAPGGSQRSRRLALPRMARITPSPAAISRKTAPVLR
jgi:hypothetical protein